MEKNKPYINQLADFAYDLRYNSIPEDVRSKVKLCIIDALECCLSPLSDERTLAADYATSETAGPCLKIGTGKKAGMADAAYFNTVKGSITNRNDLQIDSAVHAGAVIIPTVLAVGQQYRLSGREVIESILAGYEISSRVGLFLMGRINKAWRTTAVFSPVGAAISAAKAMRLDREAIASSGSFACNTASGFNEWALAGTGEDAFQNANAARNGIISALLAKGGATACKSVIEGPSGLAPAFGIHDGFEKLVNGLGSDWMIRRVIHKPIDCCIVVQAPCQCASAVIEKHPELKSEEISRITISADGRLLRHPGCANKDVNTLMQAVMSIAYGVSSTILAGNCSNISWMPPFGQDVKTMMDRCAFKELENNGPALEYPVEISIELKNNTIISHKQKLEPLTEKGVTDRFVFTAGKQLGVEKAKSVLEKTERLEHLEEVNELTSLLD